MSSRLGAHGSRPVNQLTWQLTREPAPDGSVLTQGSCQTPRTWRWSPELRT